MKRNLIGLLLTFWIVNAAAQFSRVEIPGSQVRKIHSSIVNQEYQLNILLPGDHSTSDKKYPVVYLMDAQWDFPLVSAIIGQQYYDGFIPQVILVGVTWGGTNPNHDSLRARDYTPTYEAQLPQSGGAPKFLSFMKNELLPYIESNFKAASSERVLMGCSFGGLFSMYALFAEPGLFHSYVAASPAFGWHGSSLYNFEIKYSQEKTKSPARLYMTMGGVERSVPGFEKLTRHLEARGYPNIIMRSRVLENTGHSGTKAETYARGLQFAFERPIIQPGGTILNKYIGKYSSLSGSTYELRINGNQLELFLSPGNSYLLYAKNEREFYSTAEFFNVRFRDDADVAGFELQRFAGREWLTKTN